MPKHLVEYYSKPNVKIYQVIDDLFHHTIPKDRLIIIGDTLETDVEETERFGIDHLLVETGKDIQKSGKTTLAFLKYQSCSPTFVMDALKL